MLAKQNKHTIRTSFKFYQKNKKVSDLRVGKYARLNSLFCKFLADQVLKGRAVGLPKRFGNMYIMGKKEYPRIVDGRVKGLSPNWPKTKALWDRDPESKEKKTLVFNTNEHSNGYRYRWLWSRKNVFKANKNLYSFKLSRANKRALMRNIKAQKEYLIK